ncbi:MAG: ATP synthase subunit I [Clostridia bacterium]|nr:ATP synthase subunit I [Clostridia bacterium]
MKKISSVVLKETAYIATFTVILSVLMQSVFLIIGKWNLTVLFGNLLGAFAAVLNFFLLGLTVQKAVTQDEKKSKLTMRLSQTSRLLMLFAVAIVGYLVPVFNLIAVVIPYIFPRIAIALLPVFRKTK